MRGGSSRQRRLAGACVLLIAAGAPVTERSDAAPAQGELEGQWIGGHPSADGYTWVRLTVRPDSASPGRDVAVVDLPFQFSNGIRSLLTVDGDRVEFRFRQRAGETRAVTRQRGDTLSGEAVVGGIRREFRLTRVLPLPPDSARRIAGLYQAGDGRLVSLSGPGELGFPTLTDWSTGTERRLFLTRSGFVAGPSLLIPHPPELRLEIRSGSSQEPELVIRTADSTHIAKRMQGIAEEEVEWQSEGVTIAGSLMTPAGGKPPYPVVVFVHGSGPVTRAASYELQSRLALHGIASLAYDKRGAGRSGGEYVHQIDSARIELLARDAIGGIELLSRRADIDTTSIGVWGISQAGWIVPVIAARSRQVDYTVIVSGPTTTVDQENFFSRLTGDDGDGRRLARTEISERMQSYVPSGFDPLPYLGDQRVPGLWIYGGKDESVPVDMSIANLKRLQRQGKPFEVLTFPNGQHVMWETEDGSRQHLPLIQRYVPGYHDAMIRWILRHAHVAPRDVSFRLPARGEAAVAKAG